MNIVIIGLGSMGKRRGRLIHELYPQYTVVGVDGREDRRKEAEELLNIQTFRAVSEIDIKIASAFVCTAPLSHAMIITECLNNGWNVFTELNLVNTDYEKNMALAKEKKCTLFLSSTFLYREETKYIRSKVTNDKKWNYIYHIGQYLPDWHPWENYKEFFVGDKKSNGCREILAIELPWLIKSFGEVKRTQVLSDKMSELNIGFDDNFLIQIVHENGNKGVIIVDVVSPVAVRKFEVYSEGEYISWGGTPDSVSVFDPIDKELKSVEFIEKTEHRSGYSSFIVENAYKNEINEFFNVIKDENKPLYGFEQDMEILKIIDSIGA